MTSQISDAKDVPYLACCVATKADALWSHDPHMKEQTQIKVVTNIDLLGMIKSQE